MSDKHNKDNSYIFSIAYLYLSGFSMRQIAEKLNISHITVRDYLYKLGPINIALQIQVLDEIELRSPDSLKKEFVRKRVIDAMNLFLANDLTIKEIADIMHSTEFITYRDLAVRLPHINEYLEDKVPNENIAKVLSLLKIHALSNLKNNPNNKQKNMH